ncbi:uncharacterized protein (TIGR04255 family) [Paraburkholderia sp. RAU6.4a]|uniref:TIGR04255 family protein n=1 Tax=Paraburkholderia sp. RAU6.4a TaxID=2991067 RepID=UPI003D1BFDBB
MDSDTARQKGQWASAPLVFVLAQVRFLPSAAAAPEHLRDAIIKRVGYKFPTINQTNALNFEITLDAPTPSPNRAAQSVIYDLVNSEVDAMVRVEQSALTYAVTSYFDSHNFRNQWLEITEALKDVDVSSVMRLGLRYVDFIIPQSGRKPEEYVKAPWNLAGMPVLPGALRSPDLSVSMMDLAYPEGRLRLQFMRGIGVPSLPMDLQGMLTPRQQSASAIHAECGVIDSDRWIDGNEHSVDRANLDELFRQMHTDVSSAFRAMISPLADEEWNPTKIEGRAS